MNHPTRGTSQPRRKALVFLALFTITTLIFAPLSGSIQTALAAPVSIIDDGGSNDPNGDGQNDLTRLTGDEYVSTVFPIAWSWDQPTTIKGGNASNACAMFDTDGDGKINYSFCLEVSWNATDGYYITNSGSGTDSVKDFPAWIQCSDAKNDRCTQPNRLADPYHGTFGPLTGCSIAEEATDPFPPVAGITDGTPGGAGDDYPLDLNATCQIDRTIIPATAKFVNVCSYPSAGNDGNNNPFDCVVTPGSGFLTIVKVADPNDGTPFVFNASEPSHYGISTWTINGSGSIDKRPYPPTRTLDLDEVIPTGWVLDSAVCKIQNPDGTETSTGSTSSTGVTNLEIKSGLETKCTFTDSLGTGTITVIKTVVNDNGGTASASDFTMYLGDSANTSFAGAESPGTTYTFSHGYAYDVSESQVTGYTQTSSTVDCSGTIEAGVDKTCTITNDDNAPSLTLNKTVVNDNGGSAAASDWTLTATGPTGFSGTGPSVSNGVSFDAGTYDLSESGPGGYTASAWVCTGGTQVDDDTVTVGLGESVSCTITNDDIAPRLTLVKTVVNDNGGNLTQDDFPSFVDGVAQAWDVATEVTANVQHTASETPHAGYTPSAWGGDCAADGTITLLPGDNKTCTITNDDIAPTLTLVKTVINNNGGNLTAADFPAFVDGSAFPWGVALPVSANEPHTASETEHNGYTASAWGGDCAADGTITLLPGQNKTCTITNDDISPRLTLSKTVVNDDGGLLTQADFPSFVDGAPQAWDVATEVMANVQHTASETPHDGYTPSVWGGDCAADGTITLLPGDNKTCTITNDDVGPTLTLVKTVINDNGGNLSAEDFPAFVDGIATSWGIPMPVQANVPHTASETEQYGYTPSAWGGDCAADGTITLLPGDNKTCTISNDDVAPTLTLVKTVVNNNGGLLTQADFPSFVDGTPQAWNVATPVMANVEHTASETEHYGYAASAWGGDCAADGTITLLPGDNKTCTITNNDIAPTLTLVKTVVNDNGGNLTKANFPSFVDGNPQAWDIPTEVVANVPHTASETEHYGYTASVWGGDCAANGTITLLPGDNKTCTITNDDVPPTLTLVKDVINDNGGTLTQDDFPSFVDGVAQPWDIAAPVMANVQHTASETTDAGYTASVWGGDCAEDGTVTLLPGDNKTCTITNNDKKASPGGTTDMFWVLHDTLDITGVRPGAPDANDATATFMLFSDANCADQVGRSEVDTSIVYNGASDTWQAGTTTGVTIYSPGGTFYWQVAYSGDSFNEGFTTRCGYEVTTVAGVHNLPVMGAYIPE